jgi:hypothetical protein
LRKPARKSIEKDQPRQRRLRTNHDASFAGKLLGVNSSKSYLLSKESLLFHAMRWSSDELAFHRLAHCLSMIQGAAQNNCKYAFLLTKSTIARCVLSPAPEQGYSSSTSFRKAPTQKERYLKRFLSDNYANKSSKNRHIVASIRINLKKC